MVYHRYTVDTPYRTPRLQLVCALLAANVHVARAADDVEVPATAAVSGYGSTVDSEYCR